MLSATIPLTMRSAATSAGHSHTALQHNAPVELISHAVLANTNTISTNSKQWFTVPESDA